MVALFNWLRYFELTFPPPLIDRTLFLVSAGAQLCISLSASGGMFCCGCLHSCFVYCSYGHVAKHFVHVKLASANTVINDMGGESVVVEIFKHLKQANEFVSHIDLSTHEQQITCPHCNETQLREIMF